MRAGYKRSPVLWRQFQWLVDDAVRHGDAQRGAAGLDLVFAPLKQDLIVPRDALLLLVLRGDKPGQESSQDQPDADSASETPRLVFLLQVLQKVFSIEHRDERSGGSGDDDDGRPGTFNTNKTVNMKQQAKQHLNEGREVPFF